MVSFCQDLLRYPPLISYLSHFDIVALMITVELGHDFAAFIMAHGFNKINKGQSHVVTFKVGSSPLSQPFSVSEKIQKIIDDLKGHAQTKSIACQRSNYFVVSSCP